MRVVYAKSGSPSAIDEARAEAARVTRWGLGGPINPPVVMIPIDGLARAAALKPRSIVATSHTPRERQRSDSGPVLVVCGLATPYGVAVDHDGETELLTAGAFWDLTDVAARIDHAKEGSQIGSTADGTLHLFDGPQGLRFQLDAMSRAAQRWDVERRVRSGFFHATSITWRILDSYVSAGVRHTTRAKLVEVSLLSRLCRPKQRGTQVSLELACRDCRRHRVEGYMRFAARGLQMCSRCRTPHRWSDGE